MTHNRTFFRRVISPIQFRQLAAMFCWEKTNKFDQSGEFLPLKQHTHQLHLSRNADNGTLQWTSMEHPIFNPISVANANKKIREATPAIRSNEFWRSSPAISATRTALFSLFTLATLRLGVCALKFG